MAMREEFLAVMDVLEGLSTRLGGSVRQGIAAGEHAAEQSTVPWCAENACRDIATAWQWLRVGALRCRDGQ